MSQAETVPSCGQAAWCRGRHGPESEEAEGNLHSDTSNLWVTVTKSHFAFLGLSFLKWKMLAKLKPVSRYEVSSWRVVGVHRWAPPLSL